MQYDKGIEVRPATTEEIRKHWPNIQEDKTSTQIAVVFPYRTVPTICNKNQFVDVET